MKLILILAIIVSSVSALAGSTHIKNCSSDVLEGYSDEEIEYHSPDGKLINIQGSKARSIFINLKIEEVVGEQAGSSRKVNDTYDCVKQEVDYLKCGVYLCMVKTK